MREVTTEASRLGHRARLLAVVVTDLLLLIGGAACRRSQPTTSSGGANNPSGQTSESATACLPGNAQSPLLLAVSDPIATARGVCSQDALDGLFGACFQSGGDCERWKTANGACARCVFTPEGATERGPFITRRNAVPKANQRGCLDSLASGCGGAYEALTTCTHTACGDDNTTCKNATPSQRAECRQAAMQTSCANLTQLFAEKCGPGGLTDKRMCFPPSSDEAAIREYITRLARRACGS